MRRLIMAIAATAALSGALAPAQIPENDPPVVIPSILDWSGYDENAVAMVTDLNLPGLTGGTVVVLDVPAPERRALTIAVPMMELKTVHLQLVPNSVRAADFEVREQLADGSWRVADPGEERTYTGSVREIPGSEVAASILSNGLFAAVYLPDGTRRWIEPLSEYAENADPDEHIVYRSEDTDCAGICGTDDLAMIAPDGAAGPRGLCSGSVCVAQVACDADWQYYDARGSSTSETRDRIAAIINVVNHQYVREVSIRHEITTILVRTAEPDPYTSFDPNTLLNQFRDEWQANQGGITRDMAHLFTGRDLTGSVIGIAWVGAVCGSFAYGLSQSDFSSNFACVTDLTAHEMGHNWGANHCSCPDSTMNPSITCANTFFNSGSPSSTSEIDTYSDGVSCLSSGGTLPINDTCDDATYIYSYGTYGGNNDDATTDGGHTSCGSQGGGTRDVFWRFSPPATGTVTIDTCGSSFDTILSVHDGCPATPDNLVVCDDDAGSLGDCPGTLQSYVSFTALAGRQYYIRVASYGPTTGSITLHISGPSNPTESLCGLAPAVEDGDTVFGSLFATGNDGDATCGASSSNRDIWYQFTAPCDGTLSVDTCGTNDFPSANLGTDTVLSLHTACPGDTANQIACNDDAGSFCSGTSPLYDSRVTASLTQGQNVKIRVTHFGSSFNTGYFRIHVDFTSSLSPPVINAIGNDTSPCGSAYTGPLPTLTSPACMTPVTWSLVTGPSGMTINTSTGRVSWANPFVGTHTINIRATNSAGSDTEAWQLRVNPIAPILQPIPNDTATEGVPYTGPNPTVTNGCMRPVTYSLVTGPAGMTINATSGVVSWPNPTVVGSPHVVQIRATNVSGFDDEVWAITVSAGNPCPGDLDNDGDIDITDLAILLSNFGTPSGASADQGDLDGDGDVDITDLATLLSVFGTNCP